MTSWIHFKEFYFFVPQIISHLVIPSKAPILPSNQDKKCEPGLAVASPQLSPCQQLSPHGDADAGYYVADADADAGADAEDATADD